MAISCRYDAGMWKFAKRLRPSEATLMSAAAMLFVSGTLALFVGLAVDLNPTL